MSWSFKPPMDERRPGGGSEAPAASISPPDDDASPPKVAQLELATPRGGLLSMDARRPGPAVAGVMVAAPALAAPEP
jgi:hypothetical protein